MMLFEAFPDDDQGGLTQKRAHLIRASSLASKAALLGLESFVELGPSEELARGRERAALLEDVFEAVLGAIAIDGGWQAAEDFVQRQFESDVDELDDRTLALANPKSALQEVAQGRCLALPEYRQIGSSGPDHHRSWVYEVIWEGEAIAMGEGRTKREAQQRAARRALIRLGLVPEE
jgi:ribonuclease-3